ncbi:MAG: type II toxin-antitoxin system prevent-host-death family antitoxin [Syntrophomonadaceae bacterium]|nr:type II toxin-antitoxin system prevent-host-death family antitoxin [Syntrophomonadaceae bacterium]
MRFISVRDLRMRTGEIWEQLQKEGEMVITSNGKPVAVLSGINEENLEEHLRMMRRIRAMVAVNKIQEESRQKGLDKISMDEIEAEIKTVRRNRER